MEGAGEHIGSTTSSAQRSFSVNIVRTALSCLSSRLKLVAGSQGARGGPEQPAAGRSGGADAPEYPRTERDAHAARRPRPDPADPTGPRSRVPTVRTLTSGIQVGAEGKYWSLPRQTGGKLRCSETSADTTPRASFIDAYSLCLNLCSFDFSPGILEAGFGRNLYSSPIEEAYRMYATKDPLQTPAAPPVQQPAAPPPVVQPTYQPVANAASPSQ